MYKLTLGFRLHVWKHPTPDFPNGRYVDSLYELNELLEDFEVEFEDPLQLVEWFRRSVGDNFAGEVIDARQIDDAVVAAIAKYGRDSG